MEFAFATSTYENTYILFMSIFCFACFHFAFKKLKKIRILQDTPSSKIHAAAQGYIQLEGVGAHMPGPPIKAPKTGIDCLWYEYKIEQMTAGEDASYWTVIHHQTSDDCFYIKDKTGVCIVNPDKAYIYPSRKSVTYETPGGMRGQGWFTSGRLRHTEITLDIGTPLTIIGEFQTIRQADHDLTVQDEVGELVRAWKQDYHKLLEKYDADGNGVLDQEEWEQVLCDAEKEVQAGRLDEKHTLGVHVIAHPRRFKRARPFIISSKSQKQLLRAYWWRFSGLFSLGVIVGYFPFIEILKKII